MQNKLQTLKEENKALKFAMDDSRRYSWKPLLKLHGLKESDGENLRTKIIEILARVTPNIRCDLHAGVDITHRRGPKEPGKARAVIIFFAVRRVRVAVWQAAEIVGSFRIIILASQSRCLSMPFFLLSYFPLKSRLLEAQLVKPLYSHQRWK